MKFKNETVERQEKEEARELCQKILKATNMVPPSVLQADHGTAVTFKAAAIKARRLAEGKSKGDVYKMREAWGLVSGYYSGVAL